VTAQDVAWNIQMQFDTPTAWQAIAAARSRSVAIRD